MLRLFQGLARKRKPHFVMQPGWIDGLPGYVSRERGILQTTALAIEGGLVTAVYITRNPDKLARIAREMEAVLH